MGTHLVVSILYIWNWWAQILKAQNIGWANAPVPTLFLRPWVVISTKEILGKVYEKRSVKIIAPHSVDRWSLVYLRGMVVSLATMIFVILNTYWIRWTFYLFAAISHCSLQGILKNLHKMPHLAYLKWLLKFHCFYLTDRTENYPNLLRPSSNTPLSACTLCTNVSFFDR